MKTLALSVISIFALLVISPLMSLAFSHRVSANLKLGLTLLGTLIMTEAMAQESIFACSKISNGQLRIVSNLTRCLPAEAPLVLSGTVVPPQSYLVNCGAGDKVSEILDSVPRTIPITIAIQGVCRESVTIERDDLRIEGASPDAGFEAPTTDSHVITLNGARRIELFHLSITGGKEGLGAYNSASFRAFNISVSGASENCMVVNENASGSLESSIIRNCKYGIGSPQGSLSVINTTVEDISIFGLYGQGYILGAGTVVQRCGSHGVLGSALICNAIIQDNQGSGVRAGGGESIDIACPGTIIRRNSESGATADGGHIGLREGAQVMENNGGGLNGSHNATVSLRGGVVEKNFGNGITLTNSSSTNIEDGTSISLNTGNGVFLGDTSVADISNRDSGVIITNNEGYGVNCLKSPSVAQIYIDDTSVVYGNTLGQIDCPQN